MQISISKGFKIPESQSGHQGFFPSFLVPLSDGIFLGGTFDRDDWSLAVNPEQSNRIVNTHTEIMKGLR